MTVYFAWTDPKNIASINSNIPRINKAFTVSNNEGILMNKKPAMEVQMNIDNYTPIKLVKETIFLIFQIDKVSSD